VKLKDWPFIGEAEPVFRVLRDGRGYEQGPICPRCKAWSRRTVTISARGRAPEGGVEAHCCHCHVRWRLIRWNGTYGCYWGAGVNWGETLNDRYHPLFEEPRRQVGERFENRSERQV
jgi:hypothetical protein